MNFSIMIRCLIEMVCIPKPGGEELRLRVRKKERKTAKLDLHSASIRDLRDLMCNLREIIDGQQHHLGSIAKALLTIDATNVKDG